MENRIAWLKLPFGSLNGILEMFNLSENKQDKKQAIGITQCFRINRFEKKKQKFVICQDFIFPRPVNETMHYFVRQRQTFAYCKNVVSSRSQRSLKFPMNTIELQNS